MAMSQSEQASCRLMWLHSISSPPVPRIREYGTPGDEQLRSRGVNSEVAHRDFSAEVLEILSAMGRR